MGIYDNVRSGDEPGPPSVALSPEKSSKPATPGHSGLLNIYIVDPDPAGRRAIHTKLSGRGDASLRSFASAQEFLSQQNEMEGGCVLISSSEYDTETHRVVTRLRDDRRFVCVVLSRSSDLRMAISAMKDGAADYLLRPCVPENLWHSIDEAMVRIRQRNAANAASLSAQNAIARLSAREKDVLDGLVQGKSNKEIALELKISPRTIEIYRAHMMEKLGVKSLSEALQYAFWAGASF